jgi:hypothetical protein
MKLIETHTRFIFPFLTGRGNLSRISKVLTECRINQDCQAWQQLSNVASEYEDNALPYVSNRIFSSNDDIGRYLRLNEELSRTLFNRLSVEGFESPVKLSPFGQIELFLTNYGAGVLSFSLILFPKTVDQLLDMISDLHRTRESVRKVAVLKRPDKLEDSEKDLAIWLDGLGCPADYFRLWQLRDALLSPLIDNSQLGFRKLVDSFRVFSCLLYTSPSPRDRG